MDQAKRSVEQFPILSLHPWLSGVWYFDRGWRTRFSALTKNPMTSLGQGMYGATFPLFIAFQSAVEGTAQPHKEQCTVSAPLVLVSREARGNRILYHEGLASAPTATCSSSPQLAPVFGWDVSTCADKGWSTRWKSS